MSLKELEKLKFDWKFVMAGSKTTKDCATGDCVLEFHAKKLRSPRISVVIKEARTPRELFARFGKIKIKSRPHSET